MNIAKIIGYAMIFLTGGAVIWFGRPIIECRPAVIYSGDDLTSESSEKGKKEEAESQWLSYENPVSSWPLSESEIKNLGDNAVRILADQAGFSPKEFCVKKGDKVVVLLTSKSDKISVMKFKNSDLDGIAVGVAGNETRGIAFTAPQKPGDYEFYNDMPGFYGEVGKMKVE